jgi:hypothetical protein
VCESEMYMRTHDAERGAQSCEQPNCINLNYGQDRDAGGALGLETL